jgi:hypothetical protein
MSERENVMATKRSVRFPTAQSTVCYVQLAATGNDGSGAAVILLHEDNGTVLREMGRLDGRERNLVLLRQARQVLGMRNIGRVSFGWKSRRVPKWVRLLLVSPLLVVSLRRQRLWAILDRF